MPLFYSQHAGRDDASYMFQHSTDLSSPACPDPVIHGCEAIFGTLTKDFREPIFNIRPRVVENDPGVHNEELLLFVIERPYGSLPRRFGGR